MTESEICTTLNCHTQKINNIVKGVCDIKKNLYKQCPVIIGEDASGPDSSVVLGCDAVGSDESVVVGNDATSQGNSRNVVVGYMANANNTDSVVIGHMAEGNTGSIVIGKDAGGSDQGVNAIAIGRESGKTTQGSNSIAIGCNSGNTNQKDTAIAIGTSAAIQSQNFSAIAIGFNAGATVQETGAIAIGAAAGFSSQKENSIAIGKCAGAQTQGTGAIAIGCNAGKTTQGENSIAIGEKADSMGNNNNTIILNATGGPVNSTGPNSFYVKPVRELNAPNMLCYNTGTGEISYQAKTDEVPDGKCYSDYLFWDGNKWENGDFDEKKRVHIGCNAGTTNQGTGAIAIGYQVGTTNQGTGAIAIGKDTATLTQGKNAIAIGESAGINNQKENGIAIGLFAGQNEQGTGAIAIGRNTGVTNQGEYSIAIGSYAGGETAHTNTIILNATGSLVDSTNPNSFYVKPVRELNAPNMLCYNNTTGEISYQPKLLTEIKNITFGYGFVPGIITGVSANIDVRFYKYNNGIINMIFISDLCLNPSNIDLVIFITTGFNAIPVEYRPMMNQSIPIMIFEGALNPTIRNASLTILNTGVMYFQLLPISTSFDKTKKYKVCGGQVFGWM